MSAPSARKPWQEHSLKKELELLDFYIDMPGMTGIEVIEAIGAEEMPAVIFVTAYDQYALATFEVHAVDYLRNSKQVEHPTGFASCNSVFFVPFVLFF